MSDKGGKTRDIDIAKAKGRPMLTWVGKKPLGRVTAYPAQHIERFRVEAEPPLPETDRSGWPAAYERGGLLFPATDSFSLESAGGAWYALGTLRS